MTYLVVSVDDIVGRSDGLILIEGKSIDTISQAENYTMQISKKN